MPDLSPDAPVEQRLVPGSRLHQKVLGRLTSRVDLAYRHISKRYDDWDRTDEHVRLFIDLARKARKADRTENPDKHEMPFERAVVIPAALAIMLVRQTQLMAIFGAREPMLQLEGAGPEDVRPAKLMEATLAYDLQQMVGLLQLHALCQDADKYGLGVLYDTWEEESGWKIIPPPPLPDIPLLATVLRAIGYTPKSTKEWALLRQYNRWQPVDPFHYWPDPRVPVSEVQEGEFVGHRVFRGEMHLRERSQANGGPYFNLDQLAKIQGGGGASSRVTGGTTGRRATSRDRFATEEFSLRSSPDDSDKGFFAVDHLQVKLIPKDWELSAQDRPEIWWFTVVDEGLIIRAHPSEYAHGKYTYAVGESIPDAHALHNPGMIENLDGLQRVINWLVNSHVENAKKFLNDALVYSPALIEEADLLNPGPVRHFRTTKKADELILQGKLSLAAIVYQIPFADVTAQHLRTVNVLFDSMQRLAATSDPQMSQTTDDKRTLGEVQQVIASSSQRLAVVARLLDAQALQPLAHRAIANRQQFTTMEQYVRITGDLAKEAGTDRLMIRPSDLAGSFDYVPHSGALPPDPARFAQVWAQLFKAAVEAPQLQQPNADGKILSPHLIFAEAAKAMGVKNVADLYETPPPINVMADPALAAAVQAGNVVPASAAVNGRVPGAGIQTPLVQGADLTNGGDMSGMPM